MSANWPVIVQRSATQQHVGYPNEVKEAAASWQSASLSLFDRLLLNRGVDPAALDLELKGIPKPDKLVTPDISQLLLAHRNKRVVVVADYDADGATACAVMVKGLRSLGFERVSYLVPDRAAEGYGLTPALVNKAAALEATLIITVDNGISSFDGALAAQALGIDLLVTDHHLPGASLPKATAIVNPRLVPSFEAKELAGVGVAFYVLAALRQTLRQLGDKFGDVNLGNLLDLVALGTIADVVVLDATNRSLVEQGLRRIRAGHCCEGISAIIQVARREQSRVSSADLGFSIGPRLNAVGRLSNMTLGIECLLADTAEKAQELAQALHSVNQERQFLEQDMQQQAEQHLYRLKQKGALSPVVCLFSHEWHEGVVGLLASRIKEKCHRPVFAFAEGQTAGLLKGSGRSIAGVHLRDLLADVHAQAPYLIEKFGGHAMAAGLSIRRDYLDEFTQRIQQAVQRYLTPELFEQKVLIDGELAAADLTTANAEKLTLGVPWGQGFAPPLFYGRFVVTSSRVVGEKHLKLGLSAIDSNSVIDGIHFNADLDALSSIQQKTVEAIYALESNFFRGVIAPQLRVTHLRLASSTAD